MNLLKKIILLCLISGSLLLMIQAFLDHKMHAVKTGYVGKINAILQDSIDADITIWGASTAEGNINPTILEKALGKKVFNMGLDGTNIDQFGGLLKTYIANAKTSKTIILSLDIHGAFMKRHDPYRVYDWLHVIKQTNIQQDFHDINPTWNYKVQNLPFYKLLHYGKHNIKYLKENSSQFSFPNKGFVPRQGQIINPTNEKDSTKLHFSDSVEQKTIEIIKNAKEKSQRIIILFTPCYAKGRELISNNDMFQTIKQRLSKHCEILDYSNHEMTKQDEFFTDNTHLNDKGALLFSRILASDLRK